MLGRAGIRGTDRPFSDQPPDLLAGAERDRHLLVYLDEARIHQDTDLGHGWCPHVASQAIQVASAFAGALGPRCHSIASICTTRARFGCGPMPRRNGENTIEVLRRLRAEVSDHALIVLWEEHRIIGPRPFGRRRAPLNITLMPLPGYSLT